MSNPFRRPQAPTFTSRDTPSTLGGSQSSTLPTDPTPPPFVSHSSTDQIPTDLPVPSSKVKKVRITSPPRSPPPDPYGPTETSLLPQQLVAAHHSGPASPQTDDDSSSSEDDPFELEQSSEEESPVDSVHQQPITPDPTRSGTSARLNPFSRTSVTTGESKRQQVQKEQRNVGSGEGRAGAKAPMDVDSFKNLLMTGKPTASGAATSAQPKALTALQADSSSSTDTSSISRQSLFEPHQEPHGETPRTSYELSVSEDDDRSTLIADGSKTDKRKPPLPKHRHGKVVAPKGPQIVAFDDFSATFASPSTQSLPTTISHPPPLTDSLTRRSTDSNRPLPPPPSRTSSDETRPFSFDPQLLTRRPSLPPQFSSDPLTSTKKIPPAPPLARRSSLMRSNTLPHLRRSSTLTIDETSTPPSMADSHNSSTTKIVPPPPPPSRRSRTGTGTMDPPSSVEIPDSQDRTRSIAKQPHTPSKQTSHPQQSGSAAGGNAATSPPPPPPKRLSMRSSADFGRSNAISSSSSPSTSPSPPPGSSRPSAEISRRDFEAETAVGAGAAPTDGTEEVHQERENDGMARPAADVLADMEAFQREIDELREKYGRGGGSG